MIALVDRPADQRVETEVNSKREATLLVEVLQAEAACAAYREALKNIARCKPLERKKYIAKALFGKGVDQRGKTMLKVFKAAVQVFWFSRNGTEKDFCDALKCLEVAMENFKLKGPSVRKWLKKKELVNG